MRVASVVSAEFFKDKIDCSVQRFGTNFFCTTVPEVLNVQPRLVIIDLEHPRALEMLQQFGKSAVAFGPHLRSDLHRIAREFGAQVYSRSAFLSELDHVLHQYE